MCETIDKGLWRRTGAAVGWLLAAWFGSAEIAAAQAPVAPAVSAGSYTVSYQRCVACGADWLEERPESGGWVAVASGTFNVTGKPAGTYYYRVAYLTVDPTYYMTVGYSAETRVTVAANIPPVDSLDNQLRYRYETRFGDGNGDGRVDLFVNRTAGGVAGNGTLERVLLAQNAAGGFTALEPTVAQATAWRAWPMAAAQVVLRDFNVDGFADVLVKGVAAAIGAGQALNQIIYAPGRLLSSTPLGVRAVDSTLKQFAANARDYLVDRNHFVNHAPLMTIAYPVPQQYCMPSAVIDHVSYCSWFVYYVALTVRDYAGFEPNALSAWTQESAIQENRVSQTQGIDAIRRSFETALGVPIGGRPLAGVLGEQGAFDAPSRRGFELFLAVLGIFDANAQELSPAREGARRADVVYVTGRRILGFPWLPLHTALEFNGETISAYDNNSSWLGNGVLVSQMNWSSDHPSLTMTLGTVSSAFGQAFYWQRLIGADGRYDDNLIYDPIPSAAAPGFNSNGYVHGIVRATSGVASIDLNSFVGGGKPVPPAAFN